MPKKPKFTKEKVANALEKSKGFQSYAANLLKCTPRTIYNYMQKYPELQEVLNDALEERIDVAETKLDEAINKGEPWSIAFFLKTRAKHRGYVERQEVTGKDGTPLSFADKVKKLSDDEVKIEVANRLKNLFESKN
ncbi:MAG: helix-turn-helix domain-containing protein [Candidatus Anammoxibacter sp.]